MKPLVILGVDSGMATCGACLLVCHGDRIVAEGLAVVRTRPNRQYKAMFDEDIRLQAVLGGLDDVRTYREGKEGKSKEGKSKESKESKEAIQALGKAITAIQNRDLLWTEIPSDTLERLERLERLVDREHLRNIDVLAYEYYRPFQTARGQHTAARGRLVSKAEGAVIGYGLTIGARTIPVDPTEPKRLLGAYSKATVSQVLEAKIEGLTELLDHAGRAGFHGSDAAACAYVVMVKIFNAQRKGKRT